MIWVTWRQHRAQAISMLVLLAVIAIYAVATGAWMRSAVQRRRARQLPGT